MSEGPGLTYRGAGVDLDAAARAKEAIRSLLDATRDERTLSELGFFGGLYEVPQGYRQPVLASSADGVGTKLKVAFLARRHDTVGQDLVSHCVNDILVQGARPLFFLDYLAAGRLEEGVVEAVVRGIARGCQDNGCVLLGGETAEMPDFYGPGEYDLAGFIVGIVERDRILDGRAIHDGDVVVALASNGLHTNGYSLVRRIVFDRLGLAVDDPFPGSSRTVADVLLDVHRSYLRPLWPLVEDGTVRGLAHITGGGLEGNLPRILPLGLSARIERASWPVPAVFRTLAEAGGVPDAEMFRVFNMGIGIVAIVPDQLADSAVERLNAAGETAWRAGRIVRGRGVELR
ncbi:MAG: phosphoribosylformylglycinamidine cyclo-ligase [Gemmatimonadetes bacterium]|nr:phosphoribosylformylglycinamidine cyclo-ligase [Gemmatimonadota bacterium]